MAKPVGLQLFSIKHQLAADFEGTLQKVRDMGYDAVEFFGGFTQPAERINAALQRTGLSVCGWHTGWDALQPGALYATIAYFQAIGNRSVVVPGLPASCTESIDAWKQTAGRFTELAKILAGYGMTLGYHNHFDEFIEIDGVKPIDAFLSESCGCVNWQFDIGNALHSRRADPLAYMQAHPDRCKTVHCKPYSAVKEFDCVIGEDDVDWAKVVDFVEHNDTTDCYIIEYEVESNEAGGCKDCLDGLKKFF